MIPDSGDYDTIAERFAPPEGFVRTPAAPGSFGAWLRQRPLLPEGSAVLDYRGRERVSAADSSLAAVVAMTIRGRKLDQCMDIILRFYTQYLSDHGRGNEAAFPLPDGLIFSWTAWQQGYRPAFSGLHFRLNKTAEGDPSSWNFEAYLRTVFEYSGTQAFYYYYPDVSPDSVRPGDFFVKKGNKGHAVLIVDMVVNEAGEKRALIGQGDTPACLFYILNGTDRLPWIPLDKEGGFLPLPIRKKMSWDGLRRFPQE